MLYNFSRLLAIVFLVLSVATGFINTLTAGTDLSLIADIILIIGVARWRYRVSLAWRLSWIVIPWGLFIIDNIFFLSGFPVVFLVFNLLFLVFATIVVIFSRIYGEPIFTPMSAQEKEDRKALVEERKRERDASREEARQNRSNSSDALDAYFTYLQVTEDLQAEQREIDRINRQREEWDREHRH